MKKHKNILTNKASLYRLLISDTMISLHAFDDLGKKICLGWEVVKLPQVNKINRESHLFAIHFALDALLQKVSLTPGIGLECILAPKWVSTEYASETHMRPLPFIVREDILETLDEANEHDIQKRKNENINHFYVQYAPTDTYINGYLINDPQDQKANRLERHGFGFFVDRDIYALVNTQIVLHVQSEVLHWASLKGGDHAEVAFYEKEKSICTLSIDATHTAFDYSHDGHTHESLVEIGYASMVEAYRLSKKIPYILAHNTYLAYVSGDLSMPNIREFVTATHEAESQWRSEIVKLLLRYKKTNIRVICIYATESLPKSFKDILILLIHEYISHSVEIKWYDNNIYTSHLIEKENT